MNASFEKGENFLYIKNHQRLKATNISTSEYPGLSTDWQPPLGLLLTQAQGESLIRENIFENRLEYLNVLKNMGAQVEIINNKEAKIAGPTQLSGATIDSLDIRAGATLLIAGIIAGKTTIINQAENIDRGYENIEERLTKIGAKIERQ
jgi:UDP-N-acetylglucosamine 1-carboxyvinyltransferase